MSQQEQLCVDNFKKSNPAFNRPRHDSLKTDLSSFLAQSCTDQHEVYFKQQNFELKLLDLC